MAEDPTGPDLQRRRGRLLICIGLVLGLAATILSLFWLESNLPDWTRALALAVQIVGVIVMLFGVVLVYRSWSHARR